MHYIIFLEFDIFTARCTIVQNAVLRSHVVSLSDSVRLSVTLADCDHIGWKAWKLIIIAWAISPTPSLFVAKRPSTYSQGTWENFEETRGGEKWRAAWSIKAVIFLKRVKIEEKLLWRAYRNSPTLFRTAPSSTPYGLLFLKIGGSQLPPKIPIAILYLGNG